MLDHSSSVLAQVQQFYKSIQQQRTHEGALSVALPAIPGLEAALRGYQSRAVAWMLEREGKEPSDDDTPLHVLWRKLPVNAQMPVQVYFNPHTTRY